MTRTPAWILRPALVVLLAAVLVACQSAKAPPEGSAGHPTPTPAPTPHPTPEVTPTLAPTPTPTPPETPIPEPPGPQFDEALLNDRLTVLLVGIDSDAERRSLNFPLNSDALVVASVSADQSQVSMVTIPRDTVDLPLSSGLYWTGKVNGIYGAAGIGTLRDAVNTALGIWIDYVVEVDMDSFVALVDGVGGVEVTVPYDLYDPGFGMYLPTGVHLLSGTDALHYAQTRIQDGDYARQLRQQQILAALYRKIADPSTFVDLRSLLENLGYFHTDISLDKLPTLIEIARRASDAEVSMMVLGPPRFALFEGIEPGSTRGWVMIPNLAEIRAYVDAVMGDG
jgi:LCP family protein required for cell wall assembly